MPIFQTEKKIEKIISVEVKLIRLLILSENKANTLPLRTIGRKLLALKILREKHIFYKASDKTKKFEKTSRFQGQLVTHPLYLLSNGFNIYTCVGSSTRC